MTSTVPQYRRYFWSTNTFNCTQRWQGDQCGGISDGAGQSQKMDLATFCISAKSPGQPGPSIGAPRPRQTTRHVTLLCRLHDVKKSMANVPIMADYHQLLNTPQTPPVAHHKTHENQDGKPIFDDDAGCINNRHFVRFLMYSEPADFPVTVLTSSTRRTEGTGVISWKIFFVCRKVLLYDIGVISAYESIIIICFLQVSHRKDRVGGLRLREGKRVENLRKG